jgi:hypothetical protein
MQGAQEYAGEGGRRYWDILVCTASIDQRMNKRGCQGVQGHKGEFSNMPEMQEYAGSKSQWRKYKHMQEVQACRKYKHMQAVN